MGYPEPRGGLLDPPEVGGAEFEPFRPGADGRTYPNVGRPEFAVSPTYPGGGLVDSGFRVMDTGEDPLPSAFSPEQVGQWSMVGLVEHIESSGRERVPVPTLAGYEPPDETRPSITAGDRIGTRISVFLNLRLKGVRWGWYAKPAPAIQAANLLDADVNQRDPRRRHTRRRHMGGMMPQPIFPGRVTDWPRAEPRYLSFGGEVVP